MTDRLRMTGLATGLDVDSLVKQLMKAENTRLDKIKQNKQSLQWKQEKYRDVLSATSTFSSTYFDVLKSDTYLLGTNNYAAYTATSDTQNSVSVSASLGAVKGNYQVAVNKVAKTASLEGNKVNCSNDVTNLSNWDSKSITLNINSKDVKIDLGTYDGSSTNDSLVSDINSKIQQSSDLSGKVFASLDGNKIKFNVLDNSNVVKLSSTTVTSDLDNLTGKIMNPKNATQLSDFGINASSTLTFNYTKGDGTVAKADIIVDGTKTLGDLINSIKVTTSGNVSARFSELTGKFCIETTNTGSSNSINVLADDGNILGKLGIAAKSATGQDANVTITPPGGTPTNVIRSTNAFTIDGVSYNLIKESPKDSSGNVLSSNVTVSGDSQKVVDRIKDFVSKYNDMIDKIQGEVSTPKQYTYLPLTEDQKAAMKDDDIKKWESKAKEGLLSNDTALQGVLTALRGTLFKSVEGSTISLKDLGIDTDSNYLKPGRLIITDESKLKNMVTNNPDAVQTLFAKNSSTLYNPNSTDTVEKSKRYNEEGIFQRINDVLQDYTRTRNGKGILVKIAGVANDSSYYDNSISKDISDNYDKKINDMIKKLSDKQDRYYQQFSKLESAMQAANAQQSWLSQQFSGGQ